jgi:hypothetical protein
MNWEVVFSIELLGINGTAFEIDVSVSTALKHF